MSINKRNKTDNDAMESWDTKETYMMHIYTMDEFSVNTVLVFCFINRYKLLVLEDHIYWKVRSNWKRMQNSEVTKVLTIIHHKLDVAVCSLMHSYTKITRERNGNIDYRWSTTKLKAQILRYGGLLKGYRGWKEAETTTNMERKQATCISSY